MSTLPLTAHALSPSLRKTLGTAQAGRDLAGLIHGSTLKALKRRGLAAQVGESDPRGPVTLLTDLGVATRDQLRERAHRRLEANGWQRSRHDRATFYVMPPSRALVSRAAAMRHSGVAW